MRDVSLREKWVFKARLYWLPSTFHAFGFLSLRDGRLGVEEILLTTVGSKTLLLDETMKDDSSLKQL